MRLLFSALFLVLAALPADAQVTRDYLRLDGPRIGVTYLTPELIEKINDAFDDLTFDGGESEDRIGSVPVITQFGWQFERRFFQTEQGLTGVTELIPLVGGLERGLVLPSLTFLIGLRGETGFEAGVGPNITAIGAGLAFAVGMNNDVGGLNVPVNLAAVIGGDGLRGSVLVGFNLASNSRRSSIPAAALPPQPASPAPFPTRGPLGR